jgi:hypothetical protein
MVGKQRYETFRTLDEARRAKAARTTDVERGEFDERSRVTLHEYAREWVTRYQGRGRRGFREGTREEYRRILEAYALKFFPAAVRLTEIAPSRIVEFVAWLCDPAKQEGRTLSRPDGAQHRHSSARVPGERRAGGPAALQPRP